MFPGVGSTHFCVCYLVSAISEKLLRFGILQVMLSIAAFSDILL